MSYDDQPQQQQQQQQQQQPTDLLYPYGDPTQTRTNSRTNGSFGSVFIVLSVIIVISLIACFLGRFCTRARHPKASNSKPKKGREGNTTDQKKINNNINIKPSLKQSHSVHPKDGGDIEFGLAKGPPGLAPVPNMPINKAESRSGPRPAGRGHGDFEFDFGKKPRFPGHNGDPRAAPANGAGDTRFIQHYGGGGGP